MTRPPCARNTKVGVSYIFDLSTHCGVKQTYVAGRAWVPVTHVAGTPPKGMNDPFQRGRMMLTSKTRAVFFGNGRKIAFRPSRASFKSTHC